MPLATSAHLLKLFVRISGLAELAAWRKKKLETAKAESKPRELVHARRCDPPWPDSCTVGSLILGAGRLWIPECVSARPGTPEAGFIGPAPVATWFSDVALLRAA
jgi:hypothetical protein